MSHCFLTGRRRVHPVFPSVSPSVRCSVVFVVRSLVQTVGFFLSSQTTDKKEKESHLSDPLTSDPPQLPVLPLLLGLRAPQWGKSVCSGQGFGLSRRLEDSFPVQTGFPPPIDLFLALSLVQSLVQPGPRLRSASPGGESRHLL